MITSRENPVNKGLVHHIVMVLASTAGGYPTFVIKFTKTDNIRKFSVTCSMNKATQKEKTSYIFKMILPIFFLNPEGKGPWEFTLLPFFHMGL